MATKITKSELKQMIREALREELSYTKLSEGAVPDHNVCYITYNAYGEWNYPDCDLYEFSTDKQQAEANYINEHIPFFMTGYQPDVSFLHLVRVTLTDAQAALFDDTETNKYEIMDLLKEINRNKIPSEFVLSVDGTELYDYYKDYCAQLGKKCLRKNKSLVRQFANQNVHLFTV